MAPETILLSQEQDDILESQVLSRENMFSKSPQHQL